LLGLAGTAGAIFIGVYYGARVGIGKDAKTQSSFIWWVINRLLFLAAIGAIQGFAYYFLQDVVKVQNVGFMTTLLMGVVALFLLPSALIGGRLADKMGKKRLVSIAGIIATVGAFLLVGTGFLANTGFLSLPQGVIIAMVMVSGCVIGTGTGTFMATNWALGTDLVPPEQAGKYLGISNLAGAGAGIVGRGIGGPMADFFNGLVPGLGYLVIFTIYAVLFLLSVVVLVKVKTKD
jgi:MFS family permease